VPEGVRQGNDALTDLLVQPDEPPGKPLGTYLSGTKEPARYVPGGTQKPARSVPGATSSFVPYLRIPGDAVQDVFPDKFQVFRGWCVDTDLLDIFILQFYAVSVYDDGPGVFIIEKDRVSAGSDMYVSV
jgi:hypothetical protein